MTRLIEKSKTKEERQAKFIFGLYMCLTAALVFIFGDFLKIFANKNILTGIISLFGIVLLPIGFLILHCYLTEYFLISQDSVQEESK